ncbi:cutinase transcription factor 1 beta [Fusarium heterosporum]|uniref:Cutinase transcription factor 1 beta n=1 Tax=Fusarium heterosporum TaxID=42747 RepID=A0A8H5WRB7_FUSHE|nr:cutinase transcription factor 1 beta [Fusarium heterosporum]
MSLSGSVPYSHSEIPYTTQSFLTVKQLRSLPEQDVEFLNYNRCFHLPLRTIQEEFFNQYFLYLHTYYPLINEKEFWDMFMNRETGGDHTSTMPLLVFQAMLFAASSFVSPVVLKNAGYTNVKVARNIFYRRAKLLFDFGVEDDAFTKAQAALLLTFQFSAVEPHAGSTWLAIGIQNAIVAQAHTFQAISTNTARKRSIKRLWWSLFWRDRIVTLGLRKPLQITPSSFDASLEPITVEDLADEMDHSVVYNLITKRQLADILKVQCRLAVLLTDILSICYGPSAFDLASSIDSFEKTVSKIKRCRKKMHLWKEEADKVLNPFLYGTDAHRSTTLISSVIYIYAYAAQIALGNHEAMLLEQRQKGIKVLEDFVLQGVGKEISYATTETTKLIGLIVREGLTQHLSISAQRFEGAADISRMVTQIVQSTPIQLPIRTKKPKANGGVIPKETEAQLLSMSRDFAGYWDDLFVTRNYIRLRLSLDYALITGKPPTEADLPMIFLRDTGVKRAAFGPVHGLSSVSLHTPRKRRASESVAGLPRVIELEEEPSPGDGADDKDEPLHDQTTQHMRAVPKQGEVASFCRSSFEYDTIWAANLFEEISDGLWS